MVDYAFLQGATMFRKILAVVKRQVDRFVDFVKEVLGKVREPIRSAASAVRQWAKTILRHVGAEAIVDSISEGIEKGSVWLKRHVDDLTRIFKKVLTYAVTSVVYGGFVLYKGVEKLFSIVIQFTQDVILGMDHRLFVGKTVFERFTMVSREIYLRVKNAIFQNPLRTILYIFAAIVLYSLLSWFVGILKTLMTVALVAATGIVLARLALTFIPLV